MIKTFVFDTNSIISAHLLPSSLSRKAYDYGLRRGILVFSEETLEELTLTFQKPKFDKYIDANSRDNAIAYFKKVALQFDVTIAIDSCRDPKDNKFLSLAVEAKADCIITGDNDLLVLHPFQGIPILSAHDFMNSF